MKVEELNNKAKEAFANSLIDIGVAIFKGMFITIMILPITIIVKAVMENTEAAISLGGILSSMSSGAKSSIVILLAIAFFAGHFFRNAGIKILNTINDD